METSKMRTIIAGSRDFDDYEYMESCLEDVQTYAWSIGEVVCGGARGADSLGSKWAHDNEVFVNLFPAQWNKYGRSAGYIRNEEMAQYAEALVCFWDGKSKGSKHMVDIAIRDGLYVKVFNYEKKKRI